MGLIYWQSGWLIFLTTRWIQAWIRGEDPYWDSTHEEAAYAIQKVKEESNE